MKKRKTYSSLEEEYNNYFDTIFTKPTLPVLDEKCKKILQYVGTGNDILDIGCLTGYLSFFCKERGNQVIGIDFLKSAIRQAKSLGVDARYCNIEQDNIPVGSKTFDIIICSEVIEHLIDPICMFRRIKKILKPFGFVIISTPNIAYIQYRIEALLGKLPDYCEFRNKYPERPYNFQHKSLFTHKVLKETLEQAGFRVKIWDGHSSYKNTFEKIFLPLERFFPKLFIKNIIAVAIHEEK